MPPWESKGNDGMIDYAIISEAGAKAVNEDAARVSINRALRTYGFALADGLGGHGNGDVASKFAVDCCSAMLENAPSIDDSFMDDCFETSQRLLLQEKDRMGLHSINTTLVLLVTNGDVAHWGHIGDSRLYMFRRGRVASKTLDHSVPQMLAMEGIIKDKEIRHHPDRSHLLRAMGTEWDEPWYEIDKRNVKLQSGDSFLLCSDGFWEWIDEKKILSILKKELPAYDALNQMKEEVEENGRGRNLDNFSAILINVT